MKLPLAAAEHTLLAALFDPRRAPTAFPAATAEAVRLHRLLGEHGAPDLPRADVEALTQMLGDYLDRLGGGPGVPVAHQAPLADTVDLVDQAPQLQHLHAQLVRHLEATE
ncbi:MAG TPA: hypothetical protein VM536_14640 [Chloroflexia bacterium]|nr:hypothetical protein [Chloroflexia bacterium]